ncbi:MAG: type II secretion system protein [Rickettsiales bacterium]
MHIGKTPGVTPPPAKQGFSLVELSIVLVILGLLTGGILAGQSLIRAAELRAVTTEFNRYVTATQTFRDKYFAAPGDMTNATAFWGDNNAACPDAAIANGTPGTCNGNGDGLLNAAAAAGATGEQLQYWNHLALAGLIEGTYSGLAGAGSQWEVVGGTNAPRSKLANGVWSAYNYSNYAGDAYAFAYDYGNYLSFGAPNPPSIANNGIVSPEEAWNIDTKVDDGKPGQGRLVAWYWSVCTTAASNTDTAASYALNLSGPRCALAYTKVF